MDYKKETERQLNNLLENQRALEVIPAKVEATKKEIYMIQKTMMLLEDEEQRIIQRTCIDNVSPYDLEKEFGCSYRKIYKLKDAALKKFTRLIYGIKFMEGGK